VAKGGIKILADFAACCASREMVPRGIKTLADFAARCASREMVAKGN
jgi:hypothetical protein